MTSSVGDFSACVADIRARVVTNVNSCHEHYSLELDVAHFPPSVPGQFVQVQCATNADGEVGVIHDLSSQGFPQLDSAEWTDELAYLRRPFSIADRRRDAAGRTRLLIVHRAIGKGTRWLARLRRGDTVSLTGPLGHGFSIPASDRPVILVGGGVGIPPLLYLARILDERKFRSVLAVFGARSRDLFPIQRLSEPPRQAIAASCLRFPHGGSVPALVSTDDGTLGIHGRVTDALAQWHARCGAKCADALVCACGPEPMLKAVARLTRALDLECELCIERMMGCGLGTCLACATRVVDPTANSGWRYALSCAEGPVFERDRLIDFAAPPGATVAADD